MLPKSNFVRQRKICEKSFSRKCCLNNTQHITTKSSLLHCFWLLSPRRMIIGWYLCCYVTVTTRFHKVHKILPLSSFRKLHYFSAAWLKYHSASTKEKVADCHDWPPQMAQSSARKKRTGLFFKLQFLIWIDCFKVFCTSWKTYTKRSIFGSPMCISVQLHFKSPEVFKSHPVITVLEQISNFLVIVIGFNINCMFTTILISWEFIIFPSFIFLLSAF